MRNLIHLISALVLSFSAHSYASAIDINYLKEFAKKMNLKPSTVYAMALAESGLSLDDEFKPHPYAIGVGIDEKAGQTHHESFYPPTREAAIQKLASLLAKGHTNIGVGMMQINIGVNHSLFDDVNDLFDPSYNLDIAGKVIRYCQRYRSSRSILSCYATGSNDTEFGDVYANRVFKLEQLYAQQIVAHPERFGELSVNQFLQMMNYQQQLN